MARVLVVGVNPDHVDFSDPALPPGMSAAAIHRGIARSLEELRGAGHAVRHLHLPPDAGGLGPLAAEMARDPVDCVVVGGGVRLPRNLPLFEALLNVVVRSVPPPAVALTIRPEDAPGAVARVLGRGGGPGR